VAGLLVAAAGIGVAVYGATRDSGGLESRALIVLLGLALAELGLVAACGGIIALVARSADRLPFTSRFAVRDAARQRGRTAPAVAAVMAAIAGGSAALLYVASQQAFDRRSYRPATATGVVAVEGGSEITAAQWPKLEAALRRNLPSLGTITPLRSAEGAASSDEIQLLLLAAPGRACPLTALADGATPEQQRAAVSDPRCVEPAGKDWLMYGLGGLMVDDGSALEVLTGTAQPAARTALAAGRVVLFDRNQFWPDGTAHLQLSSYQPDATEPQKRTVVLPATLVTGSPKLRPAVLPAASIKRLGMTSSQVGLVAGTSRLPTVNEEEAAGTAVDDIASVGFSVERGFVGEDYSIALLVVLVAALVVTLGGTFTAVGLAAAEGRADVATLAAVGASPGVRRRIAAGQAGVIAGLGAVLGAGAGVLSGWCLVHLQRVTDSGSGFSYFSGSGGYMVDSYSQSKLLWELAVPWPWLGLLLLGVPLLAVLIGFSATRSRLQLVRRLGQ
jgi:putative ABC transport system permease protein